MNIEQQKRIEQFYIDSGIIGVHTDQTNTVEINYLDMVKLVHRYAESIINEKLEISANELSHYNSLKKQDIEHRKIIKKLQLEINKLKLKK